MLYDIKYNKMFDRNYVLEYLKQRKQANDNFTLIDVGSYGDSWAKNYITATVDIQPCTVGTYHFTGDMNLVPVWKEVFDHVNEHGKFNFAVCTGTLEDISSPKFVCDMLEQIAEEGYIAVPSKYVECRKHPDHPEEGPIRGWIHHRWIYNIEDGKFIGYPKLPFTEYLEYFDEIGKKFNGNNDELSFFWKEMIDLHIINNDFFPSSYYMYEVYKNIIND